jgi:RES domain-containing protein
MIVWRLTKERHAGRLDGAGNRAVGARWNSPGRGVVYTAANLSLCVLESLVHMDLEDLPDDYVSVRLEIPDDVGRTEIRLAALPPNWRDTAVETRRLGDAWLAAATDLALIGPSVIVPQDMNVMLSPSHPDMARVVIGDIQPFKLDPRLVT